MKYELTFSDRKPNNLMNMSIGTKIGVSHFGEEFERALQELSKKKTRRGAGGRAPCYKQSKILNDTDSVFEHYICE